MNEDYRMGLLQEAHDDRNNDEEPGPDTAENLADAGIMGTEADLCDAADMAARTENPSRTIRDALDIARRKSTTQSWPRAWVRIRTAAASRGVKL